MVGEKESEERRHTAGEEPPYKCMGSKHVAGEPTVDGGEDFDDPALNTCLLGGFCHLLHQQIRQQKMSEVVRRECLDPVLENRVVVR